MKYPLGLAVMALSSIRENTAALRAVDLEGEGFKGIYEAIKAKGFMGVITARNQVDPDTKEEYLEIIDGLHRFTACKMLGLTEIKVDVQNKTDKEVLEDQMVMNLHRVATKPAEYAKQIRRMLAMDPMLTEGDVAISVGKSLSWVKNILSINNIANAEIGRLIDEGKICLANAIALAKLPVDEQEDFVERSMTMKAEEFIPTTNARVKELRDAKMKGKDSAPAEFVPVAHVQPMSVIRHELDTPTTVVAIARQQGITDPEALVKLTLAWVLSIDPVSSAAQRAKDEERKAGQKAAADQRTQDRLAKAAAKKLEEAAKLQEQIKNNKEAAE